MAEQYSIVHMYHSFLIHSSADGHLGCFHVLAIINSAVMNNGIHVSLKKWAKELNRHISTEDIQMANKHFSILAWKIPMDKGACWVTLMKLQSRTQLSD